MAFVFNRKMSNGFRFLKALTKKIGWSKSVGDCTEGDF